MIDPDDFLARCMGPDPTEEWERECKRRWVKEHPRCPVTGRFVNPKTGDFGRSESHG